MVAGSFPSVRSGSNQGNGNHQRNARHQGKDVRINGSNNHHRSTITTIKATATPFGIRGRFRERDPTRQGRCDSLVVVHSPLRVPEAARAKAFASMDITKVRAFASMGQPTSQNQQRQPSEERKASRQGRSQQWEQQTSQSRKGNHRRNGNRSATALPLGSL